MAKQVTIIKVVNIVYTVEGDPSEDEAIDIVKARMAVKSPLGLVNTTEDIQDYVVEDIQD